MRRSVRIRKSQFIFSFGPGALLETLYGTRLIRPKLTQQALRAIGKQGGWETIRISDQFLERMLEKIYSTDGVAVFEIPTAEGLGLDTNEAVIESVEFPTWKQCNNFKEHKHGSPVIFRGTSCPECGNTNARSFRYVRICENGHLDEIDWFWEVHRNTGGICRKRPEDGKKYVYIENPGAPLGEVYISCPYCGSKIPLGSIYYSKNKKCTGRRPEENIVEHCGLNMTVQMKQSTAVTIPEIFSYFTILVYSKKITDTLKKLKDVGFSPEELPAEKLAEKFKLSETEIAELKKTQKYMEIDSFSELMQKELERLAAAAVEGIPPVNEMTLKNRPRTLIHIDPQKVFETDALSSRIWSKLTIIPIEKLTVTHVRVGYRRGTPQGRLYIQSFREDVKERWLPATRYSGEGVFIMLGPRDSTTPLRLPEDLESVKRWLANWKKRFGYENPTVFKDREERYEPHPSFVMLHTLAHILIREISKYTGYPTAAIKERVYVDPDLWDEDPLAVRGGILLYTAAPGSDGTLGGITTLFSADNKGALDHILGGVRRQVTTCSNDPLCSGHKITDLGYNGAACYACAMLPETSCEHRNMWLDRNILREVMGL